MPLSSSLSLYSPVSDFSLESSHVSSQTVKEIMGGAQ
jgi:hypothetical protein